VSYKPTSEAEEVEFLNPPQKDDGPVAAYVFKSYTDKYGTLTFFRLFSGSLETNDTAWNSNADQEERLGQLMTVRGKEQLQVDKLHAGDIGVVAKLRDTHTGHTLSSKDRRLFIPGPKFPEPVFSVAVHPRTQSDSAKLATVLNQITQADQTLTWYQDASTKEAVLGGMGSVQIDIAISKADRLGASLDTTIPKVPYKETITKTATAEYRHKKQSGGAGQFAEVHLRVEPQDPDEEFEFASEIFGGAVSGPFVQSTEKGVRQVLGEGVIAGYPVVGVKAIIFDGKEHPVDSKDIAFQIAGRGAFKEAFSSAGPVLLEPIVSVEVIIPEDSMGDIISDITSRRGRVQGMDTVAGRSMVKAQVPHSEMLRYSNDLRSMTAGRGVFNLKFSHYEKMPSHLTDEVIAAHKAEEES
jgi:elongation factor G